MQMVARILKGSQMPGVDPTCAGLATLQALNNEQPDSWGVPCRIGIAPARRRARVVF